MPTPSGIAGSPSSLPVPALQLDCRPNRLAGGREDAERLVTAQLEQGAAVLGDYLARQRREPPRELGGRLVPALVREPGVATDIGDQEGAQIRRVAHDPTGPESDTTRRV